MPTYRAQDLANRIINVFYIPGDGLPRESYESTAVYNYRRGSTTWASVRSAAAAGTVNSGVSIQNDFAGGTYTLARTGVQFSTTWGIVPVGIAIGFALDYFNLPEGGTFKIQAFKGTSTALTGDQSEYAIPLDQGLVPYTNEITIDGISSESIRPNLYFNQTAINDFLANPDQNLFILGEYDYNNIAPTDRYGCSDTALAGITLSGQS
jgi:hypothetical protein